MIYYSVEKSGYISTADIDVKNRSEIVYIDSTYTGIYGIFGVGTTTFNVSVPKVPEKLSYTAANIGVGTIKYTTDSKLVDGGIDSLQLNFGGLGYQSLPSFIGMGSTTVQDAQIVLNKKQGGGSRRRKTRRKRRHKIRRKKRHF